MQVSEEVGFSSATISPNRRRRRSYSLRLPLLGRVIGTGPLAISGETVNISSSGILFLAAQPITLPARLVMIVDWPATSSDRGRLQLEIHAHAVRCTEYLVAAKIDTHRFVSFPPEVESSPDQAA